MAEGFGQLERALAAVGEAVEFPAAGSAGTDLASSVGSRLRAERVAPRFSVRGLRSRIHDLGAVDLPPRPAQPAVLANAELSLRGVRSTPKQSQYHDKRRRLLRFARNEAHHTSTITSSPSIRHGNVLTG